MQKFYVFNNALPNSYLYLSSGGIDPNRHDHHYGPGARSGNMLHLILSGKGVFTCNNTDYHLSTGDIFFCKSGEPVYMQADHSQPWTFLWVRFTGSYTTDLLEKTALTSQCPVFKSSQAPIVKDAMLAIIALSHQKHVTDLDYATSLLSLIAALRDAFPKDSQVVNNPQQKIVWQATQYIHNNYDTPLSIATITQYLGVDRSYLFRLFKEYLGQSPKEYLTNVRIHAAKELLANSETAIKVIALSCGYADYIQFSKAFKKREKQSPSEFRKDAFHLKR